MITYDEFIKKPISEKTILAWIEPSYRLSGWTIFSGSIYYLRPPEYVIALAEEGISLTQVVGLPSGPGEWSFDDSTKTAYIWTNSGNPNTRRIRADFRIFFASGPFILPYDLNSGRDIEYLPKIDSTSQFGYEFDSEQMGIMLEGQGSITLHNGDGYFDDIWEKYFWENKPCRIYSWSPSIPITEAKLIYKGYINAKNFSSTSVSFGLTDFISKLQDPVPLDQWTSADGIIPDSQIGKMKRRLYGRVDGLRLISKDQTLDGFDLTGILTGDVETKIINGIGTLFLSECSPEDDIIFGDNRYKIETISSDTLLNISRNLEISINGAAKLKPKIPYRLKNRTWHIASHPIKKIRTQITAIISKNRFTVTTIENLAPGDVVVINGQLSTIRRASGSLIVLMSNLPTLPSIGDYFERYPVQALNVGTTDFVLFRDYSITNSSEAILILDSMAEVNVTEEFPFVGSATFTNGSRIVSGSSFDTNFSPRDWIRASTDNQSYEVLSIDSPTQLTLRTAYAGSTQTIDGFKKNVTYLNEDSILTANCFGRTKDGSETGDWIKTGAEVVYDLLKDQGLDSITDSAKFAESALRAPEIISLKLPLAFNSDQAITTIDAINLITTTSLGALYSNQDFQIAYSIVVAKKDPNLVVVEDDDILSFDVTNKSSDISREVIGKYRHVDADRYTGEDGYSYKSKVNDFVDQFMDTKKTRTIDLYIYDEDRASILVRRYGLLYESGSTRVTLTTKLNLSRKNIGDTVYLKLDRLYKRFGSDGTRRKISSITGVTKSENTTIVTLDDFGNIFTKVACFSSPGDSIFSVADEDQQTRNGYFVDASTQLSDDSLTYKINLFG